MRLNITHRREIQLLRWFAVVAVPVAFAIGYVMRAVLS